MKRHERPNAGLSVAVLGAVVAVLGAVLVIAVPVEAQIPAPGSQSQQTAETVNLTMEDRHVIKEIILKDLKISPPQDQIAKVPTKVGEVVPQGIPLQPMPVEVSAKVPQVKSHSFLVKDDKVVIVDPKDNKVAALVE
jgi:membrane-bound ClpP family serine protease